MDLVSHLAHAEVLGKCIHMEKPAQIKNKSKGAPWGKWKEIKTLRFILSDRKFAVSSVFQLQMFKKFSYRKVMDVLSYFE